MPKLLKTWPYLLALFAIAGFCSVGYVYLAGNRNFVEIQEGMSRDEVEAILGSAPTRSYAVCVRRDQEFDMYAGHCEWLNTTLFGCRVTMLSVHYNPSGIVQRVSFSSSWHFPWQ